MKTLILILLDESRSMTGQKEDVIKGFNSFINGQKEIKGDQASVTFFKFNKHVIPVLKCVPIEEVPELGFHPNRGTALYDAIWAGVQEVEKTEHLFDRVICVIMTDGEDNSSKKITKLGVGDLIKKKENEGKWTFMYIGENPENWARDTGMSENNTIAFNHETQQQNFTRATAGVSSLRSQTVRQTRNAFTMEQTQVVEVDSTDVTMPMLDLGVSDPPPPYSELQ